LAGSGSATAVLCTNGFRKQSGRAIAGIDGMRDTVGGVYLHIFVIKYYVAVWTWVCTLSKSAIFLGHVHHFLYMLRQLFVVY